MKKLINKIKNILGVNSKVDTETLKALGYVDLQCKYWREINKADPFIPWETLQTLSSLLADYYDGRISKKDLKFKVIVALEGYYLYSISLGEYFKIEHGVEL